MIIGNLCTTYSGVRRGKGFIITNRRNWLGRFLVLNTICQLPAASYVPISLKCHPSLCPTPSTVGKDGDIGKCPISQYRKKKWQILKYPVENQCNSDTTFNDLSRLVKVIRRAIHVVDQQIGR